MSGTTRDAAKRSRRAAKGIGKAASAVSEEFRVQQLLDATATLAVSDHKALNIAIGESLLTAVREAFKEAPDTTIEETWRLLAAAFEASKKVRNTATEGIEGAPPLLVNVPPAALPLPVFSKTIMELLGGRKVLRRQPTTPLEAHEMLRDGLPARSMESLVAHLSILGPAEPSLAKALGTSWRTIQRQKKTPDGKKRLSQEQSGRMWKFAEILAKATEVFGSQPDAERWMQRPATGLEQRRPIELLETPAGTELVEDFLERLEYGVYT